MKTLNLINRYLKILEQGESLEVANDFTTPPDTADATDVTTQPEEQEASASSSEGEKFYSDLLVQAFAYPASEREREIVSSTYERIKKRDPRAIVGKIQILLGIPPNSIKQAPSKTEGLDTKPLTQEGERYYIDLLVRSFNYTPTNQELNIVDSLNTEMGDDKPRDVAESIEKLLNSTEDSMEDTINKIDVQ